MKKEFLVVQITKKLDLELLKSKQTTNRQDRECYLDRALMIIELLCDIDVWDMMANSNECNHDWYIRLSAREAEENDGKLYCPKCKTYKGEGE